MRSKIILLSSFSHYHFFFYFKQHKIIPTYQGNIKYHQVGTSTKLGTTCVDYQKNYKERPIENVRIGTYRKNLKDDQESSLTEQTNRMKTFVVTNDQSGLIPIFEKHF